MKSRKSGVMDADRTRTWPLAAMRTLGAVALLATGGIHYQQYHYAYYSRIPTIGALFLLNFLAAAGLGLFLLSPVRPRLGRLGKLLDRWAALAGIGVAAGALVALLISEHTFLFGFMEHGYRFVIVFAIVSEAASIVILTLYLIFAHDRRHAAHARARDRDDLTMDRRHHPDIASGRARGAASRMERRNSRDHHRAPAARPGSTRETSRGWGL